MLLLKWLSAGGPCGGERWIKKVRDEWKATQVGGNDGEVCVGGPAC